MYDPLSESLHLTLFEFCQYLSIMLIMVKEKKMYLIKEMQYCLLLERKQFQLCCSRHFHLKTRWGPTHQGKPFLPCVLNPNGGKKLETFARCLKFLSRNMGANFINLQWEKAGGRKRTGVYHELKESGSSELAHRTHAHTHTYSVSVFHNKHVCIHWLMTTVFQETAEGSEKTVAFCASRLTDFCFPVYEQTIMQYGLSL